MELELVVHVGGTVDLVVVANDRDDIVVICGGE